VYKYVICYIAQHHSLLSPPLISSHCATYTTAVSIYLHSKHKAHLAVPISTQSTQTQRKQRCILVILSARPAASFRISDRPRSPLTALAVEIPNGVWSLNTAVEKPILRELVPSNSRNGLLRRAT
jgi:hypothetical protein